MFIEMNDKGEVLEKSVEVEVFDYTDEHGNDHYKSTAEYKEFQSAQQRNLFEGWEVHFANSTAVILQYKNIKISFNITGLILLYAGYGESKEVFSIHDLAQELNKRGIQLILAE